tara:strand:- start:1310 stop:1510 length:201 start_codon:yes stop_codon:yes gene_type:complete
MNDDFRDAMKIILIFILGFLFYQSPGPRNAVAKFLRNTADLMDTNPNTPRKNSEYIQIPNPLYQEE